MKPFTRLYLLVVGSSSVLILILTLHQKDLLNKELLVEYIYKSSYLESLSMSPVVTTENIPPLLTVFTTFKETPEHVHHEFAHRLAISNWASFAPLFRVVLFSENLNSRLSKLALQSGWDLVPLNRINPTGAPYLKDMYKEIFQRYNSTFYGYANGDLLFDDSLVGTLQEVERNLERFKSNILVVGIRTNVEVESYSETEKRKFTKDDLQSVSRNEGKLFIPLSEDYFFSTGQGCSLNWTSLPDVVIGRVAYDNYLVATAIRQEVNTIDATKTILALHVSKKGVVSTGRENVDTDFNFGVIGPFDYNAGATTKAPFETIRDSVTNEISIVQRH